MSQALYRKWRPARFDDVVGQDHVTRTLQNSVAAGRVSHAYLLCGPRGTGKTTTARLIAKAVNCLHEDEAQRPCNECSVCQTVNEGRFLDLIEIDAASNTGVDDIRDLRDKINFSPNQGRFKVYIIDEVHMLSTAAFNALLKTLEEPPPHAKFVLATTEEHKVPLTIKSRCQQFNFRLLTDAEIMSRLNWLAEKESLKLEPAALALIAKQGAGSLRDAESLLDQLVAAPGDLITLSRAQAVLGTATDAAVSTLTNAWLDADGARGLEVIHDALASGTDARQFCRQMVSYLRRLLLMQAAGDGKIFDEPAERLAEMMAQAARAHRPSLIEAIKHFNEAAMTPASSWQPQLPLELAFVELLPAVPAPMVTRPPAAAARPPATAPVQPASQAAPKASEEKPTAQAPEQAPVKPQEAMPDPAVDTLAKAAAESVEEKPAAQPDAAKAAETAPSAASGPSLAQVQGLWRDLVAQVGQHNKNLPALLNMGKPLALEGSTLVIGFDYPIFKEKFDNTAGAAQLMGEVLSEMLQQNCGVRGVVTSEYPIIVTDEEFHEVARELGGVVSEE